jgi:uncharacterized protein (DUF433 family)
VISSGIDDRIAVRSVGTATFRAWSLPVAAGPDGGARWRLVHAAGGGSIAFEAKNTAMSAIDRRKKRLPVLGADDPRIAQALFTLRETAGHLEVPKSTIHEWARPPRRQSPLITCFRPQGRQATVPFVGFAEAYVLSAFRRAGVPLQRIRPAVQALSSEIGIEHALASRSLYTDGAEVLYDYAEREADDLLELQLVVVRTGQHQFSDVVRDYLQRITYGEDGWASRVRLPSYGRAEVVVDPSVAFGLPLVVRGGARVEDLVDRFVAGDSVADIADDFGVPADEVEAVIRVATRTAA